MQKYVFLWLGMISVAMQAADENRRSLGLSRRRLRDGTFVNNVASPALLSQREGAFIEIRPQDSSPDPESPKTVRQAMLFPDHISATPQQRSRSVSPDIILTQEEQPADPIPLSPRSQIVYDTRSVQNYLIETTIRTPESICYEFEKQNSQISLVMLRAFLNQHRELVKSLKTVLAQSRSVTSDYVRIRLEQTAEGIACHIHSPANTISCTSSDNSQTGTAFIGLFRLFVRNETEQ